MKVAEFKMNKLISIPLRLRMVYKVVVWSALSFDDVHDWSFEVEFLLNQIEMESSFLELLKLRPTVKLIKTICSFDCLPDLIIQSHMSIYSPVGEINQMTYDGNWLPKSTYLESWKKEK